MAERIRDSWAEWLLQRRFGGDPDALTDTLSFLEPIRDRVLDSAAVKPGATLLDIGTGDGLIAFGALKRVGDAGTVIFSDISVDLLTHCQDLASQMGVSDRCRFIHAPAEDLSAVENASVDAVTSRSALIYVDDKQRAFREIYRVLKPGGQMSVYEPINRISLPQSPYEFTGGFNVAPVQEVAAKVQTVFEKAQPSATDSMTNFDERDLLQWLEGVGFAQIELDYEVRIGPVTGMKWDTYRHTAFNPRMPTLDEAMAEALTHEA